MNIDYTNNSITKYYKSGIYNISKNIDLTNTTYSNIQEQLIVWIASQLQDGEKIDQIILECAGKTPSEYQEKQVEVSMPGEKSTDSPVIQIITSNVPTSYRDLINAAISVSKDNSNRTFVINSESLPSDNNLNLRDSLIEVWNYVENL